MATTGTLVEWLAAGVTQTSGTTLASGKVRFYQPGTLTPQSVFSDSACTSAISQPITLSSGGTAIVYANASVRMIVKDPTDTSTLFDVVENVQRDDNTFVTSPSFNGGAEVALSTILDAWATTGGGGSAVNWGYKQSGSATERALKSWMAEVHVSVKDFGAVGDGAANDTTAVQAAITAVGGAGGGVVYFPPGTYLINAALTMGTSGVSLLGAGSTSSVIKNSGGATNALTVTGCSGFAITALGFSHSTSGTGAAIQLANCSQSTAISRLAITGHRTSLNLTGGTGFLDIFDCSLTTPASSGTERCVAMANSNDFCVVRSNFMSTGGICIELTSSGGNNVFNANYLSGTGTAGLQFNASYSGQKNTLDNNTFLIPLVFGVWPTFTRIGDNQGLEGTNTNVTTGGTITPDRAVGPVIRIAATSTGSAFTINAPTPTPSSLDRNIYFTMVFQNQAGGPITGWTMNAAYHLSSGPSTTDGQVTSYLLRWDNTATVWRELSRSVTT